MNPLIQTALDRLADRRAQLMAADPAELMRVAGLPPDPWQAELLRSVARQSLLLCTRQAGKSTVTAALATHTALYTPESLVLLLSPSLRQSQELFRKVVDFYNAVGQPVAADASTALKLELSNGSRIVSLPGDEKTIRGFSGVRLLVVDEAARVADSLYFSVRPMLAVSGGRMICLSTPFGKRGFFHDVWNGDSPDWQRVKITAYDCPRISRAFLDEERKALGDYWFDQEYMCIFRETIDSVFSYDLIMSAISDEVLPLFSLAPDGSSDVISSEIAALIGDDA